MQCMFSKRGRVHYQSPPFTGHLEFMQSLILIAVETSYGLVTYLLNVIFRRLYCTAFFFTAGAFLRHHQSM